MRRVQLWVHLWLFVPVEMPAHGEGERIGCLSGLHDGLALAAALAADHWQRMSQPHAPSTGRASGRTY